MWQKKNHSLVRNPLFIMIKAIMTIMAPDETFPLENSSQGGRSFQCSTHTMETHEYPSNYREDSSFASHIKFRLLL